MDPGKLAVSIDNRVAAELASVGLRLTTFEPSSATEQFDVLLGGFPPPDSPERPATEVQSSIGQALLVADDGELGGETSPVAGEDSWVGKGDDNDLAVTQFVSSSAHGVDVCLARQSSQMTVQDEHERASGRIARFPNRPRVVDEFDIGKGVADR